MARLLTIVFWALIGLYFFALLILAVGPFGWFGQERDPLSAVFLVPLGLPWTMVLDFESETARPWLAILAPILNIAIVGGLARLLARS